MTAGPQTGDYVPTDKEARAIALFATDRARQAEASLVAFFLSDPHHARDRQRELIAQAASEYLYAALETIVQDTPGNPEIFRSLCHGRVFGDGLALPGSRYGIDNPDNIYRLAIIDPAYRYVLTGQRPEHPPTDAGLTLMAGFSGDGRLADSIGFISLLDIPADASGSFELRLDAEPANSDPAHFSIAGGKVLFFRDTLAYWSTQERFKLRLRCLSDDPSPDTRSDDHILAEAERLVITMADTFMGTLQHRYVEHHPANIIKAPRSSGDHGGLVTQHGSLGWYDLADDEALIVEIDPMRARYVSLQIADLWTLAYDYTERMSSMNGAEAITDSDGRIRFVIAANDPGVHNWLDSGGHRIGSMTLRWHHADPSAGPHKDTVVSRMAKLCDLAKQLPSETRFVTHEERAEQCAQRAAGWQQRLRGDVEERHQVYASNFRTHV